MRVALQLFKVFSRRYDHEYIMTEIDDVLRSDSDHISTYELVSSIDFDPSNGHNERTNQIMTKISGNKFVALCESNVSEITVNQSVSQDEILSDRDDLGEEEGSILPEYGEGNDAKGKEEMKEVCEDKSNTGVDKTNEESKDRCEMPVDILEENWGDMSSTNLGSFPTASSLFNMEAFIVKELDDDAELDCKKVSE